jgi:Hg(II)-responsive transcriptional regulator
MQTADQMIDNRKLKSGELARRASVNVETLRYYEREGLLPEPERSEAGYRYYAETDVQRVQFIKRAQELGFTLKEIKELLALKINPKGSAAGVKEFALQKIQLIDHKIQLLQNIRDTLVALSEACPGEDGTVDACPILHSFTTTH